MFEEYNNNNFEAGKVIVALRKNSVDFLAPEQDIRAILDGLDYVRAEVIYDSKNAGDESGVGYILLVSLRNKNQRAVINAIRLLSANPHVVYAEPDYLEDWHRLPDDPLYGELWGAKRVEAPLAWNYSTGSAGVAVGVIDSGIDYHHQDIRRNMWLSPDRKLANGWDFASNTRNSSDTNGHGTHVAGTIGAVGNNCIGITGICWDVRVVSMKFGLDVASAVASIYFANQFKIPILNASWGGRGYSKSLKYAIEQYNGLFIASAGNDGKNNDDSPVYPASYDSANIISVAAINPDDTLAGFSNYGVKSVDIAAPGTNILSLDLYGGYSPMNGTSMAAPHVAGAAALLKAYRPMLSALDLKNIILASATESPNLTGRVLTGGILNINAMFTLADGWQRTGLL